MCCGRGIIIPTPKQMLHGIRVITMNTLNIDVAAPQTISSRENICRWCEFSTKKKQGGFSVLTPMSQCNKCACLIHHKIKAKKEACPEKKWDAETKI